MKKIILTILLLANINTVFASTLQSTNMFPLELNLNEIPSNKNHTNNNDSGLITAITLGSIGGLGLGALGVFLYKKYSKEGLTLGYACGCESPILPLCLDEKSSKEILAKYPNNTLLRKALFQNGIKECPNSKYILIPDSEIVNRTFDTYVFEIPKNLTNLRITQAILPDKSELKLNLYIDKNQEEEIDLNTTKKDVQNGILITQGENRNSNQGVLVIENNHTGFKNTENQKYAIVIEFFK